jgi:catechol 2,3-dioxygenase-like lactoylglutathione lyase family enzyme
MITGAHTIIYSENAEADIAFFRDVLKLSNVDVGNGWLIFGLPPAEIAFHPGEENGKHELYLMCDDVQAFVKEMTDQGVACSEVRDMRWGLLTSLKLPGGGSIGVYEPRHARPAAMPTA